MRNPTRAALVVALRDLALHVQHTSQGKRVTLISSGFPVQKGRSPPVGLPPAPANVPCAG
jgi:hypothetical protein